jgi:hypothetical protein
VDGREAFMNKKRTIEIVLVFALLLLGTAYVEHNDHEIGSNGEITRNAYGEGSREVDLILNADTVAEDYVYTLTVEEMNVTEDEARQLFEEAIQEIDDTFLEEGQTLDHVSEKVHMEAAYVDGKVSADWNPESYEYIDYDGNAVEENISEEGELMSMEVELACGNYKESYQFSFMLFPRELTGVEELVGEIDSYLNTQQTEEGAASLKLPESVNGITLGWDEESEHLTWKVFLLEGLFLLLLPLVERSRKKETEKKRRETLMLDYPEVVSKLNVLVGAGMTMKQTWHIISAQYIEKREKNATRESLAFEEMVRTDREIQDGESERIAYQRFGERIGVSSYRRLVRLLISNLQKGNRGLCEQLEQEAETAFGERRLLAKRLGEEAGTKLLFPMMLMLGIVMVIVLVPAMVEFTV